MGGGFALLMGTTTTVGVAATFYGDVPRRADDLEGVCPVIASHGGKDRLFTERGRRLERYLENSASHTISRSTTTPGTAS